MHVFGEAVVRRFLYGTRMVMLVGTCTEARSVCDHHVTNHMEKGIPTLALVMIRPEEAKHGDGG